MYLAYLDDSDTKQKPIKIQVMSGVIVPDMGFKMFDVTMRVIRNELVPAEKLDEFEEFHAAELYGGYGIFEGIERQKRIDAVYKLLGLLAIKGAAVVYGAVDISKTKREVFGSADPLDIAFRICLREIDRVVRDRAFAEDAKNEEEEIRQWFEALVLLIVDECPNKQRDMLQNSFRNLRHPLPSMSKNILPGQRLMHFHDDVFFGDSRYSAGIQLADLCSYFIARHLQGDEEIRPFYELIEPHIAYGQFYPEQKDFKPKQPTLNNLRLALSGSHNEGKRVQEVRSDDGRTAESSPQRNQEEVGTEESDS